MDATNPHPSARSARPDDFFAALTHGLGLMAAGLPLSMLGVMSRGAASRGFPDAADGYDHLRLRFLGEVY